jgi:hypothetical protein
MGSDCRTHVAVKICVIVLGGAEKSLFVTVTGDKEYACIFYGMSHYYLNKIVTRRVAVHLWQGLGSRASHPVAGTSGHLGGKKTGTTPH